MRRRSLIAIGAAALTLLGASLVMAQGTDKSYFGTWRLNVAKSKYEPGPGPKEQTRITKDRGAEGIRITTKGVGPQGNATTTYTYKLDGMDVPITNSAAPPNTKPGTIAIKGVDAFTVTFTNKNGEGKVTGTGTRTLSKDGKTMTITTKGTNPQGQPISSNQVWEKQ
jgi:hypothetical protein